MDQKVESGSDKLENDHPEEPLELKDLKIHENSEAAGAMKAL